MLKQFSQTWAEKFAACAKILICIGFFSPSCIANAETTKPVFLSAKTTIEGKKPVKWLLTAVYDDNHTFITNGKRFDEKGTSLKLSRGASEIVWRFFATDFPSSPKSFWSGDFAFSAKKDVIFILLSSGNIFWIQKVSSSNRMTDAREDKVTLSSKPNQKSGPIRPSPDVSLRLPAILSTKIKVAADNLALTFNADQETEQQLLYSLTTRKWTRLKVDKPVKKTAALKADSDTTANSKADKK